MKALREKLEQLREADATCPVCRSPLSPENRQRVLSDMEAEGKAARQQFDSNAERIKALDAAVKQHEAEAGALQKALKEKGKLQARSASTSLRQKDAEAAAQQVPGLSEQAAALSAALDGGQYAPEAQARRGQLAEEFATLQYDAATHEALRTRIDGLRPFEKQWLELESALSQVDAERGNRDRLAQILTQSEATLKEDRTRQQALEEQVAGLAQAQALQSRAEQALAGEAALERNLRDRMAAARQKLDYCDYLVGVPASRPRAAG